VKSPIHSPVSDLCSENRTEAVPTEADGFVADVDTALEKWIFNLTERQSERRFQDRKSLTY
jgi:hypothetical protein